MDPAKFPRIASSDFMPSDVSTMTNQTETSFSHLLHFPEELLQQLKKTLSGHLGQGDYLSTVDIVTALMWLIYCEVDVATSTNKTLPERLKKSIAFNFLEAHRNGASWVPSNYSGNAMFGMALKYQEIETDLEKDIFLEMLLNAALTVRREILGARGHQAVLAKHLTGNYYLANDRTLFENVTSSLNVMFLSSWTKLGFEDIDIGAGMPCFISSPYAMPRIPEVVSILPGLKSGGVFVSMYADKSKQKPLFNSRILNECAPDVNFVFGKDPTNPEFNLQL